jgi:peptidoglycan hydrolase-like protein with peptidoglycan-binding domain
VLKNYCEGEDVKEVQKRLIELGYSCGPDGADGRYGNDTEEAVKKF